MKKLPDEGGQDKIDLQALKESETRLRSIFLCCPDAIIVTDAKGKIEYMNPAAERAFNRKVGSFIGKDFGLPLVDGESTEIDIFRPGKDPGEGDMRVVETEWLNEKAFLITIRDITERKRQQQQQIRRLATVVRDSYDAITIQDFKGQIITWNRGAELMYGYSEKEALEMSINLLTRPDKVAEQNDFTRRLIAGEKITSFETKRVTKDGRILDVWLTVTKVLDDSGKPVGIASTERDVTERNKQQQQQQQNKAIKKINEDLVRSNKELEQFAYVASHDLQEPLRTITSFVELLERRYKGKLDTEADEFIGYITQSTSRMNELIADLLELSRINTSGGEFTPIDSAYALGMALDNLRSAIDSSGAIITSNDMPVLIADASQLTQLFQNLIDNGMKFRRDETSHINISVRRDGGAWLFAVADNGIGIELQYADKIFQIFQKLHGKDKYPGSGIGLAISKKIVERHGGRIWVESKFGEGSTFYFTIPTKEGGKHD